MIVMLDEVELTPQFATQFFVHTLMVFGYCVWSRSKYRLASNLLSSWLHARMLVGCNNNFSLRVSNRSAKDTQLDAKSSPAASWTEEGNKSILHRLKLNICRGF